MSTTSDRGLHWPGTEEVPDEYRAFDQELGELPDSLWSRTDLRVVNVGGNGLRRIDARIGRLGHLRMLDLGRWFDREQLRARCDRACRHRGSAHDNSVCWPARGQRAAGGRPRTAACARG